MALLAEWLLLLPEVCGSNPVIGKFYNEHIYRKLSVKKMKMKKRGREWPIEERERQVE